jgi:hypothetical protein
MLYASIAIDSTTIQDILNLNGIVNGGLLEDAKNESSLCNPSCLLFKLNLSLSRVVVKSPVLGRIHNISIDGTILSPTTGEPVGSIIFHI